MTLAADRAGSVEVAPLTALGDRSSEHHLAQHRGLEDLGGFTALYYSLGLCLPSHRQTEC